MHETVKNGSLVHDNHFHTQRLSALHGSVVGPLRAVNRLGYAEDALDGRATHVHSVLDETERDCGIDTSGNRHATFEKREKWKPCRFQTATAHVVVEHPALGIHPRGGVKSSLCLAITSFSPRPLCTVAEPFR